MVRVGPCYYEIYSFEHCGHSNDSEKFQTFILVIREVLEIDFISFDGYDILKLSKKERKIRQYTTRFKILKYLILKVRPCENPVVYENK